jgi:predicted nucleic acid-binding protein
LLLPGQTYPSTFRVVCEAAEIRGNLAFDPQVVAVCIEHGVHELITADRDFSRSAAVSPQLF